MSHSNRRVSKSLRITSCSAATKCTTSDVRRRRVRNVAPGQLAHQSQGQWAPPGVGVASGVSPKAPGLCPARSPPSRRTLRSRYRDCCPSIGAAASPRRSRPTGRKPRNRCTGFRRRTMPAAGRRRCCFRGRRPRRRCRGCRLRTGPSKHSARAAVDPARRYPFGAPGSRTSARRPTYLGSCVLSCCRWLPCSF